MAYVRLKNVWGVSNFMTQGVVTFRAVPKHKGFGTARFY
jgi:hypothetical protein